MKRVLLRTSFLLLLIAIAFTSCKKAKDAVIPDDTSDQKTQASDEANVQAESDQAVDDANTIFMGSSHAGARLNGTNGICGATIDSSDIGTGKITLNFDGTLCTLGGRKRSGKIILELSSSDGKWNTPGSTITVRFEGYKVTRNGKFIAIDGVHTITNVKGGLVKNLSVGGDTLVHKIRGVVQLTFEDSTKRKWLVMRSRAIMNTSDGLKVITSGDSTLKDNTKGSIFGQNRAGNTFETIISKPVVLINCNNSGIWNITDGIKVHKGIVKELTVAFGYKTDETFDGTCNANTYKLSWTNLKGEARVEYVTY